MYTKIVDFFIDRCVRSYKGDQKMLIRFLLNFLIRVLFILKGIWFNF